MIQQPSEPSISNAGLLMVFRCSCYISKSHQTAANVVNLSSDEKLKRLIQTFWITGEFYFL